MPFEYQTLCLLEGKTHAVFQTVEAGAVRSQVAGERNEPRHVRLALWLSGFLPQPTCGALG